MAETSSQPARRTPWREVCLAAAVAAVHAVWLLGRLHPDETFQVLEPAMFKAFGFGTMAWEWEVGLRNWAVPGLVAWLLKASAAVGVVDPWARRAVIAVPQFALHAAMLAAVWRFSARRVGADLARWCLWLVALFGPVVWFGNRTMSESISTAFLVWGLERLEAHADGHEDGAPVAALGGALLGFAEVARYGSAAVIAPAMLWLLLTRRWRTFAWATAGGLAVGLGLGLFDLATWGHLFHSFRAYVAFNVLSGEAARRFGASPWHTYREYLLLAPWAIVGLWLWRKNPAMRAWLFVAAAVGYLVSISATPHKEARFIYPTLVLLAVAGTPAFVQWVHQLRVGGRRRAFQAAVAFAVVSVGVYFVAPTPFDVQRKEQFQLTVVAGRQATGFVLVNEGLWGSGGLFYLGRNIPWFNCDFPQDPRFRAAMRDPRFNRLVTTDDRALPEALAAGFTVLERRGPSALLGR